MTGSPLIASLAAAVEARPDGLPLRPHLARLLLDAGRHADGVAHAARALQQDPANAEAQSVMQLAPGSPAAGPPPTDDLVAYHKRRKLL